MHSNKIFINKWNFSDMLSDWVDPADSIFFYILSKCAWSFRYFSDESGRQLKNCGFVI